MSDAIPYPYHQPKAIGILAVLALCGVFGVLGTPNGHPEKPVPTLKIQSQDKGTVELVGTASPKTVLSVVSDDREIAKVQVPANGSWRVRIPLTLGNHRLWVRYKDDPDMQSASQRVAIGPRPLTPVQPGNTRATVNIRLAIASPIQGAVLPEGEIQLSGQGKPDSEISVFEGNTPLKQVKVDPQGHWAMSVSPSRVGDLVYRVKEGRNRDWISVSVRPKVWDSKMPIPCPCNLQFDVVPKNAVVTLFKSFKEVGREEGPQALFFDLGEGDYTYNVYTRGYRSLDGKLSLPRDRRVSIVLKKPRL